jgi:hypothetical protein
MEDLSFQSKASEGKEGTQLRSRYSWKISERRLDFSLNVRGEFAIAAGKPIPDGKDTTLSQYGIFSDFQSVVCQFFFISLI